MTTRRVGKNHWKKGIKELPGNNPRSFFMLAGFANAHIFFRALKNKQVFEGFPSGGVAKDPRQPRRVTPRSFATDCSAGGAVRFLRLAKDES